VSLRLRPAEHEHIKGAVGASCDHTGDGSGCPAAAGGTGTEARVDVRFAGGGDVVRTRSPPPRRAWAMLLNAVQRAAETIFWVWRTKRRRTRPRVVIAPRPIRRPRQHWAVKRAVAQPAVLAKQSGDLERRLMLHVGIANRPEAEATGFTIRVRYVIGTGGFGSRIMIC